MTLRAAAERFGLSQRAVYRLAHEGRLHPVRIDRRILYPAWELERAAQKRTHLIVKEGYQVPSAAVAYAHVGASAGATRALPLAA